MVEEVCSEKRIFNADSRYYLFSGNLKRTVDIELNELVSRGGACIYHIDPSDSESKNDVLLLNTNSETEKIGRQKVKTSEFQDSLSINFLQQMVSAAITLKSEGENFAVLLDGVPVVDVGKIYTVGLAEEETIVSNLLWTFKNVRLPEGFVTLEIEDSRAEGGDISEESEIESEKAEILYNICSEKTENSFNAYEWSTFKDVYQRHKDNVQRFGQEAGQGLLGRIISKFREDERPVLKIAENGIKAFNTSEGVPVELTPEEIKELQNYIETGAGKENFENREGIVQIKYTSNSMFTFDCFERKKATQDQLEETYSSKPSCETESTSNNYVSVGEDSLEEEKMDYASCALPKVEPVEPKRTQTLPLDPELMAGSAPINQEESAKGQEYYNAFENMNFNSAEDMSGKINEIDTKAEQEIGMTPEEQKFYDLLQPISQEEIDKMADSCAVVYGTDDVKDNEYSQRIRSSGSNPYALDGYNDGTFQSQGLMQLSPSETSVCRKDPKITAITGTDDPSDAQITMNPLANACCYAKIATERSSGVSSANASASILVDAGHGCGASGATSAGYKEKDFNLEFAKKVKAELEARGFTVYMTRENDTTCISNYSRKVMADSKNVDLFLSIHANSASTAPSRTEIYAQDRFFTPYPDSREVADVIVGPVANGFGISDKVVKTFSDIGRCSSATQCITVMTSQKIPTVLIEAGFINNSSDREKLFNSQNQANAAAKLADALAEYYSKNAPKQIRYITGMDTPLAQNEYANNSSQGNNISDGTQNNSSSGWHNNIYATRHDFSSEANASGENCSVVYCVALPDRSSLRKTVEVCDTSGTKCKQAYVVDLGPFCVADSSYVFGTARPYAETHKGESFEPNEGPSCNPRSISNYPPSNGAGIDLSQELANYLGVSGNGNVNWRFLE